MMFLELDSKDNLLTPFLFKLKNGKYLLVDPIKLGFMIFIPLSSFVYYKLNYTNTRSIILLIISIFLAFLLSIIIITIIKLILLILHPSHTNHCSLYWYYDSDYRKLYRMLFLRNPEKAIRRLIKQNHISKDNIIFLKKMLEY